MNRFLPIALAALVLAVSCTKEPANDSVSLSCVQPPFLKPGDKIALISPSYYTPMENVDTASMILREWGFEPVVGPNVGKEYLGHYAGIKR